MLVLGGQGRSHAASCVSSVGPGEAPPPGLTYGYEGFHAAWSGQSGYPTLCPGTGAATLATSGGDFVAGDNWGSWSGSLFVATLKETDLRRFTTSGATATLVQVLFDGAYGRLRTLGWARTGLCT